jgi:phospholipid/cholesterol/gamma-HCH transport system substrate-binding protein
VSPPLLSGRPLVSQRLRGLLLLVVLSGLVTLTVLQYQQRFTPVAHVVLQADRAGNQLSPGADVKVRGLLVGRVEAVSSTGQGARLELAIDEDKVGIIARDVTARLLPKTLFGEKFVALVPPARPDGRSLRDGDVIGQDRSTTALETEKVLDDLLPLLRTLKPEQLSTTLHALSTALRGRGEDIGENLVAVDAYFTRLNPQLPAIQDDIRRLAQLSEDYDQAAPDVLAVLDHFSALSRDLVDQQEELRTFLSSTAGSTAVLDSVLRENERRFIDLAEDSLASLAVYARYSPEFPCLAAGLVQAEQEVERTFGAGQPGLHITLELAQDNNGYQPGDEPRNGDDGGPTCMGLPPNGRIIPFPFHRNAVDGYRDGQPANPRTGEVGPSASRAMGKAIVGAVLDVPAGDVPDIADLLFGPVARGTTVRLS